MSVDIIRYADKLHQPWNHCYAEFDVLVLPSVQRCCPTQGTWETGETVGVWLNGMTPDTMPLGQCGTCGQHIYPTAVIVDTGSPVPDWLAEAAEISNDCDYCGVRARLRNHDGDNICEHCFDYNYEDYAEYFTFSVWDY